MSQRIKDKIETYFLSGILFLALVMVFLVFRPYISILLLAVVMVVLFYPLFNRINKKVGDRRTLTSILVTLIIILIILIPLAIFTSLVVSEITNYFNSNDHTFLTNLQVAPVFEKYNIDFKEYFRNLISGTLNDIGSVFKNLAKLFVELTLTIVSMIYLFKDGVKIREALMGAMPLEEKQKDKLQRDLGNGIRAVIGGYFLIAILQGIVTGFGFWVFGVPNPALFGFVAMILALLPSFGTSLINIPGIVYLFWISEPVMAIGLAVWYVGSLAIIDNYIGPKFVSGRVKIHILLLIFSTIGGLKLFGPIGIITGPLILIFFWSILEIFQDREDEILNAPDA